MANEAVSITGDNSKEQKREERIDMNRSIDKTTLKFAFSATAALSLLSCVLLLWICPQSAWAASAGPYAMIYKSSNSYTYTLVFQNDDVPDSRYGVLAEKHDKAICDSPNPDGSCTCWDSWDTSLNVTRVIVRDVMRPHTLDSWFWGMGNLESVDLTKLDTSQVYDMSFVFYNCHSLKSIDLGTFDTSKVKNFSRMFAYCYALKSVNVSSFNTSSATDMSDMFTSCYELEVLDLASFDMRNVLDATDMFPNDNGKLSIVKVGANGNVRSLLPTPDRSNIEGATGKWLSSNGNAYSSAEIPSMKADVYKAQRGYSVANMDIDVEPYSYTYNGKARTPAVTVELDYSIKLVKGKDFTVSYSNNVNAGTATVAVTGKGNYGGTATQTFTIYPFDISKAQLSPIGIKDYTGKAIKPVPVIRANGTTLKLNKDFTCKYYWNKKVGKAMVDVQGKGNYSSSESMYFTIAKRTKQSLTISPVSKTAKASVLKKKSVSLSKPLVVKGAKGKVTYQNVSSQKTAKKFLVNAKSGKIALAKGTKKGTYKVRIKVAAAGNSKFKPATKTVTVKVRVK